MGACRRVSLVVPKTTKTQATGDPTDAVARSSQKVTGHFVLDFMLMVAASREVNADVAAVESHLQEIPQGPMVIMRRPVHFAPVRGTDGVDSERESVGEREISARIAATASVIALFCKRYQFGSERICGSFSLFFEQYCLSCQYGF